MWVDNHISLRPYLLGPKLKIVTYAVTYLYKNMILIIITQYILPSKRVVSKNSAITTKIVSSHTVYNEVYLIKHHVIMFVGDLWQVGGFLWVLRFLRQ